MYLDNKLFGVGTKMYRKLCQKEKYYVNKFSCTTHPHNFYFQLLAENGLIGFFGFILVNPNTSKVVLLFGMILQIFQKNLQCLN